MPRESRRTTHEAGPSVSKGHVQGLCARFHKAVELVGARWTGAIIQLLMQRPSRYAELRQAVPDINDRMLAERLRELEEEGIVVRHVVPETPVRVEYQLTDKGRALEPALMALSRWAERYVQLDDVEPPGKPAASGSVRRKSHQRRRAARA